MSGNVFCKSSRVFFSTLSTGIRSVEFSYVGTNSLNREEWESPVQDQRCQSGPSAKNSFIHVREDSSKNCGADQKLLQISDFHFDKFTSPATFACWKDKIQDWGMHSFTISYGSHVGSKKWSSSGWSMQGLFQHWTKIIHNSPTSQEGWVWRNKSPKRGPFPSRKTDRFLI